MTRLDAARASAAIDARDDADAAAKEETDRADVAEEDASFADAEENAYARLGTPARPSVVERILGPDEHPIRDEHLPLYVHTLARRLRARDGKRLLLVGGAVRDLLLGRVPRDFDLLTDASWRQDQKRMQAVRRRRETIRSRALFLGTTARARARGCSGSSPCGTRPRAGMRAEALGETEDISEDAISEDELEEGRDGRRRTTRIASPRRRREPEDRSFEHRAAFVLRVRSLDRAPSRERDGTRFHGERVGVRRRVSNGVRFRRRGRWTATDGERFAR